MSGNELIKVLADDKELIHAPIDRVRIPQNSLEYGWKPLNISYGTKRYNEDSDRIRNNCKYVSSECMKNIVNKCLGTVY